MSSNSLHYQTTGAHVGMGLQGSSPSLPIPTRKSTYPGPGACLHVEHRLGDREQGVEEDEARLDAQVDQLAAVRFADLSGAQHARAVHRALDDAAQQGVGRGGR